MRIKFPFDGMVEARVDIDEMIDCIFDRPDELAGPIAQKWLLNAVDALRAMPDDEIKKIAEITRKNVAHILREQAGRYEP